MNKTVTWRHQQKQTKKDPNKNSAFSTQITRKVEAYRKYLNNIHPTPANCHRKNPVAPPTHKQSPSGKPRLPLTEGYNEEP